MDITKISITAIAVVLIIIVALIFYIQKNRKGLLAKAALYAVSKAEEAWGSNTGRIKFAEAYLYLSKNYPVITLFLSENQITEIIEEALKQLKLILATKVNKELG